ncbi:MAG TPA: hypothetical protein DHV83_06320 [Prevotella sp.]|nr:hypothetical protein [Prevotella sp.]
MPGENIIRGERRLLRLQEPSDHHVRIDSYSRPNNLWGKDEWRGAENLGTTEEDKNVDDVLSGRSPQDKQVGPQIQGKGNARTQFRSYP